MNTNESYPAGKDSQNRHRNALGSVSTLPLSMDLRMISIIKSNLQLGYHH